jgi:DNA-binding PadR family transcriptional regulator
MIAKELVAASTEPLILSLLSQGGESYGYALIQEVRKLSQEQMQWTDGMLYPVLHRMEDKGWIRSRWKDAGNGRKRKYYSIKRDGQRALGEQRAQWTTVHSLLAGLWKEQYV